jgi:hypothetical protein
MADIKLEYHNKDRKLNHIDLQCTILNMKKLEAQNRCTRWRERLFKLFKKIIQFHFSDVSNTK